MFNKTTTKLNLFDYLLISLISVFAVVFLYRCLYPICGYENLSQLMVSDSVYKNHNKDLDIAIFFVYVLIFFCIMPIFYWIKNFLNRFFKNKIEFNIPICPKIPFKINYDKYKFPIFIFEILTSFGYLIFYPFNGILYKKLLCIIVLLIAFSIFDAYKNLFIKENKTFSIFAIAPIFLIIFGTRYDVNFYLSTDPHHYGERYVTFYMHEVFNLQYYKDIMLVHGWIDLISSFLGKFIFNSSLISAEILGWILLNNLFFLFLFLSLFFIFKNVYFLSFLLLGLILINDTNPILLKTPCLWSFYYEWDYDILFVLTYFVFLKKELLQKPFSWLLLYIPVAFIFPLLWTTKGSFWLIASLPLCGYVLYKFVKSKQSIFKWISIVVLFLTCFLVFKTTIFNFFAEAGDYVHSNLVSFGLNFPYKKYLLHNLNFCICFFALFITPYFIVELIKELKNKDRNLQYIFVLVFCIIFVFAGLPYYFGRIGDAIGRLSRISILYLSVVVPYLVMIKNLKIYEYLKRIAVILFIFMVACSYLKIWKLTTPLKFENVDKKYEDVYLNKTVKDVVNKYSKRNDDFYVLLNNSVYYVYTNKKIPVKFVNYYNIVDQNLDKKVLEQLKHADVSLILLKSSDNDIVHDKLLPSLRNNATYRWILLNNKFTYLEKNNCVFLVKNDKNYNFSKKELENLDKILAREDLEFLPQAWGDSLKSLPVKEIRHKFKLVKSQQGYVIVFESPIKGSDVDLVYLSIDNRNIQKNFEVFLKKSSAKLNFASKSENALFPLDNFPSWLLQDKIDKIYIKIDSDTKIKEVKFYKRK